jgi:hypothetical protein
LESSSLLLHFAGFWQYLFHCIFCEKKGRKKVKVKGSWTTEGTVRFEYDGGVTVPRIAQEKHDEHLFTRIRGVDLVYFPEFIQFNN